MTRQRTVVLEEVRKVAAHPGADEIYEMVCKRFPRFSLGTIYRNREILIATRLGWRPGACFSALGLSLKDTIIPIRACYLG